MFDFDARTLVGLGANVNETYSVYHGRDEERTISTPLSIALNFVDYTIHGKKIIQFLVNNGADINILEGHVLYRYRPTFFLLSNVSDIDVFKLIINHPTINIEAREPETNNTFIHRFIIDCHLHSSDMDSTDLEKLQILLEKFDVNIQNSKGMTALHFAAYSGLSSFIDLLIHKNADPNISNASGKTPLDLAVEEKARLAGAPRYKFDRVADHDTSIKLLEHYTRIYHLRKPAAEKIGRTMFEWGHRPPMSEDNAGGVLYRRAKTSYETAAAAAGVAENMHAHMPPLERVGPNNKQGGGGSSRRHQKRSTHRRRHRQRRSITNKQNKRK